MNASLERAFPTFVITVDLIADDWQSILSIEHGPFYFLILLFPAFDLDAYKIVAQALSTFHQSGFSYLQFFNARHYV